MMLYSGDSTCILVAGIITDARLPLTPFFKKVHINIIFNTNAFRVLLPIV